MVGDFVEGSYAVQTAIAASDLDLTIVFRKQFVTTEARQRAQEVTEACRRLSALELDISLITEAELRSGADPMFRLDARLLYGQEIRHTIPLISIERWARQRIHAAYWLMSNVFNRPKPALPRLPFPFSKIPPTDVAIHSVRNEG